MELYWPPAGKSKCMELVTSMYHLMYLPRRPRGSESGREKRRDESFQVWAKEPLGTDSHRTISKKFKRMPAPNWAQKMLCIIVLNRRTVSPEFFSWVLPTRLTAPGSPRMLMSQHSYSLTWQKGLCRFLKVKFETFFKTIFLFLDSNKRSTGTLKEQDPRSSHDALIK